jgi:hypothetical protein
MKTQTLAFIYAFSGCFCFMVAKTMYLNGLTDHWFPVWLNMMIVVSFGALAAVVYTNIRRRF